MSNKFSITQKILNDVLSSMQPICNKRTTLDITQSFLFEISPKELVIKATDLEVSLQANLNIESNLIENVNFLISGKRIFELVREMEGIIEFTLLKNQLQIKSTGVDLELNIQDAQEFPPFPERIENLTQIESGFLLEMLNKVAFLIPQNNSNAALNGMLLEFNNNMMSMVVTDGHRLAKITTKKYNLSEDKKWLLPKRAILELKKILEGFESQDAFLGTCGNQLVFSGGNYNFFTKLISEPFPQYTPILNKEGFKPAQLDKKNFLKTLKRTNCLLAGQFVSATFKFAPGKLDVNLQNKEVGNLSESLKLKNFNGDSIEGKYYSPYLLSGLQVFDENDISFLIKNSERPIIFESNVKDYEFTYLVMPVSISQNKK